MEKIYRNKIIFIMLIAFIIISCNNHKINFRKFEQKYPSFELDSFLLFETTKFETFIDYDLTTLDSNKLLSFSYIRKNYDKIKKGSVYFEFYHEKRLEGDTIYVSAFDENKKLLYSFKHTENRYAPAKDAIYLKGRYYYYYKFYYAQLNKYQRQFYEEHEDSIVSNHVNEIPEFDDVFGKSKKK